MRKSATITINDKVITINELTVRQIIGLKDTASDNVMDAVQTVLPLITDASPEFLLELTPSELHTLWDKVKEVNHTFFTVIPLDKILAEYQAVMIQTMQESLHSMSTGLSVRGMAQ